MVNRRTLLAALGPSALGLATLGLTGMASLWPARRAAADSTATGAGDIQPLDKPAAEWRDVLSPERYRVLFDEHTEPPHSSRLNDEDRPGSYLCAACRLPLFDAADKFDSGTGWPSFTRPLAGHVATRRDYTLIWPRTEYHCIRCGGHQGHVFNDGPEPRGERWCNNGLALEFVAAGESLPELRS